LKNPIPFGKYTLLDRINVGGMAEVFKAKTYGVEGFERIVAVKRILPSIAEDQDFIEMFIEEAKLAVQLTHANIAQIFDLGKVADAFFIALEFVHGRDLRAIFDRARKRGEPLPIPLACYSVMKVCEGLDYAHNKKDATGRELQLIHRDVSPQNVLVSYDGEVKLIDFGIAKAASRAGKTQAGILKGKFGYMSPEQVRGLPLDRRSDVFSVGIVLYELLTGERLFVGESDFSTIEKVRNVELMPPSTYNPRIPEELEAISLKALAKDVEDRYATAMELHDDLQSFMYTSGNFFQRKDLAGYMKKAFADEIAKEAQKDQASSKIEAKASPTLGMFDLEVEEVQAPAQEVRRSAGGPPPPPPPPPPRPSQAPRTTIPSAAPAPPPAAHVAVAPAASAKQTMLGMAAPAAAAALAQAPGALPPDLAGGKAATPAGDGGLDMDWDEEELATQVYDKDIGMVGAAMLAPPPGAPAQQAPKSAPALSRPSAAAAAQPAPAYAPPATAPPPRLSKPATFDIAPPAAPVAAPAQKSRTGVYAFLAILMILGGGAASYFLFIAPGQEGGVGTADPFAAAGGMPGTSGSFGVPGTTTGPEVAMGGTGISLETDPAAGTKLFVDDREIPGSSPFAVRDLTPGRHRVKVEKGTRFAPWTTEVDVTAGQMVSLPKAVLVLREVLLKISSTPAGAAVTLVEGERSTKLRAETPLEHAVSPTGTYRLRFEKRGHEDIEQAVTLPAGQDEVEVAVTLTESERVASAGRAKRPARGGGGGGGGAAQPAAGGGQGFVSIQTRPWSQVYIDGRFVRNTPVIRFAVPAGNHQVTCINDQFGIRASFRVRVRANENTTVTKDLTGG